MSTLPLHYLGLIVGYTTVDPWVVDELPEQMKWTLDIPEYVRRLYPNQATLVAGLQEDESALQRCHPIYKHTGPGCSPTVRLSRVVLRPKLATLLKLLHYDYTYHAKYFAEMRSVSHTVWRVTHVNRNRVDCRVSNLREVLACGINPTNERSDQ